VGRGRGQGGSKGFEFAREMWVKVGGEYRVSSLLKQKKKGKITLSFASLEKEFFFIIYEVFVKQKKKNALLITTTLYCTRLLGN
jgi:hypothetical protein